MAEGIKGAGPQIRDIVKSKFIQEEVQRRAGLLERLVVALNAFRKEGFKIKPDQQSFDASGKLVSEGWTKAALDKKKKYEEKLAKAEKAFEKALGENDYGSVENVIKELQAQGGDSKGQADEKSAN